MVNNRMRLQSALLALISILMWTKGTTAQTTPMALWKTMTKDDGLMASKPRDLTRMNDGQLIITFEEGLQLKRSRYSVSDTWLDSSNSELTSEWIIRLISISGDSVLVTSGVGDTYLLDTQTRLVSPVDVDSLQCREADMVSAPSLAQQRSGSGLLWSSADKLWYMPSPMSECIPLTGLPSNYSGWVSTFLQDSQGWWIGTQENGLWRFEVDSSIPTRLTNAYKIPVPGERIRSLWRDGDTLWIGTSGAGLLKYSVTEGTSIQFNRYNSDTTKLSGSVISDFLQISDTLFLVGTTTGLDLVNSETNTVIPIPIVDTGSGIPYSEIEFLHMDKWGTIWVGHSAGISFAAVESLLISELSLDTLGVEGPVSALAYSESEDRLWIGTNGNVLSSFSNGTSMRQELDVGAVTEFVANNTVTDILLSDDWIVVATGSHGLVYRFFSGNWLSHSLAPLNASQNQAVRYNAVRRLKSVGDKLMIATEGSGLLVTSLDSSFHIDTVIDQPTGLISSLALASEGRMLVGSYTRGAMWYSGNTGPLEKALPWKGAESVIDQSIVHDVFSTTDGLHLAATSGGLISWANDDSDWRFLSTGNGLPSDHIINVHARESNLVWFSTEKAICQWHREDNTPLCLGVISPISPESIQPTSMQVLDDHVVLGTSYSILFVQKSLFEHLPTRRLKPLSLSLRSDRGDFISLNNDGKGFELDPLTRVVRLNAELSAFAAADNVRFQYQLRGVDSDPSVARGTVMEPVYHELTHRSEPYIIDVDVFDDSGRLYSTQLSFVLPLPFWQTWWFYGTCVLTIVGIVSWRSAVWFKMRRREARELQLALASGREQERANLSRQIHDLPLQNLYIVKQHINRLETEGYATPFHDISLSIDHSIDELRRICGELLPPSLGPFGLESAIRSFLRAIQSTNPDLRIIFKPEISQEPDTEYSLAIVRALQTSVTNVVRHANATSLDVRVESGPSSITLDVMDDGLGFVVPHSLISLARKRHYGLLGLHELAIQFGGSVNIRSTPEEGTWITFDIDQIPESKTLNRSNMLSS